MGTLRDDESKRKDAKARIKALWGELLDCDADLALKTVEWYLEKTNINKKHLKEMQLRKQLKYLEASSPRDEEKIRETKKDIKQTLPPEYPDTIFSGDILHVKFGIGVGVELSDGHYAIILSGSVNDFV
ncbi:hypothetical protein [Brevibacillus thermoruber]|uniref:hypothetical protein n=1 Tax=Brevibacillus thermoruber TaxID=33942 RepID=UPI00054FDD65|nr:hypothetical protein [Brevibacillus thermoruber]